MNKEEFINELSNQTKLDKDKCILINNILEDTFLIGKNNKEKKITRFMDELNLSREEANNIYNTASNIMAKALKEKLKHPFKSLD